MSERVAAYIEWLVDCWFVALRDSSPFCAMVCTNSLGYNKVCSNPTGYAEFENNQNIVQSSGLLHV